MDWKKSEKEMKIADSELKRTLPALWLCWLFTEVNHYSQKISLLWNEGYQALIPIVYSFLGHVFCQHISVINDD